MDGQSSFLLGKKIAAPAVRAGMTVRELVESTFLAYNSARLKEACRLFTVKMLEPNVTIGMSLSGALTPAGLGSSCIIPLIEHGMVDWIVSTGANLYHDTHFALGKALHAGSPFVNDTVLRENGIVRIYDVLFSYDVLLDTDRFYYELMFADEFQRTMGTAEFHNLVGKYLAAREEALGVKGTSVLVAAYRADVPVYTSSPGDSSIGMNVAAAALKGSRCAIDPSLDVNETAAIVYEAAQNGHSAVVIFGGGSPKNFMLQTEPHIQEVLGLEESGHTYFLQFTDARPDTGGLSGATPSEAVSCGKVDPEYLPDAIVCYLDTTVAMPILTAYAIDAHPARPLRRLYARRGEMLKAIASASPRRPGGEA
ncbi:MAG: deoxyhypusine synthase [Candidatus Hydrogenedentes bacterium]|nr:deoxyhypusine synthase [Candidatus Hydrogenedentota bacterium]